MLGTVIIYPSFTWHMLCQVYHLFIQSSAIQILFHFNIVKFISLFLYGFGALLHV